MTGMVVRAMWCALALCATVAAPKAGTCAPRISAFHGPAATANADAASMDERGAAVALSGNVLLVGVPRDDLSVGDRAGSVLVYRRGAQGWVLEAKLVPPMPRFGGGFGAAVAIDGATAVVGATGESGPGGSAFVFVHDGEAWQLQASLVAELPPDASVGAFGAAVAVKGGRILVGAPGTTFGTSPPLGAAFVFTRAAGAWSQQAMLRAPLDAPDGTLFFGGAAALSDTTALVGTRSPTGGIRGEAYAFEDVGGGTWGSAQRLVPPVLLAPNAGFGASLAMAGDLAVVAAPWGPAQVLFRRVSGQWQAQSTISVPGQSTALAPPYLYIGGLINVSVFEIDATGTTASPLATIDAPPRAGSFGAALAADGARVAVGAPGSIPTGYSVQTGAASVHIATSGAFALEQYLEQAPGRFDRFGAAVAVAGDTVLVGAPGGGPAPSEGVVHWLERRGGLWQAAGEFRMPGGSQLDLFGSSLALTGDRVLVGAPGIDGAGGNGSAWIFRRTGSAWLPEAALEIPDAPTIDQYGAAVALLGERAFVGAPLAPSAGATPEGAVHVFRATPAGWVRQQVLRAPGETAFSNFGAALAAAADLLLVGAPSQSTTQPGAVHVFQEIGGAWQHVRTLTGDTASSRFGTAIHMDGENAWIGAPFTARGSVYRFPRDAGGFGEPQRIDAPSTASGFGEAISGTTDRVFVGASVDGFTFDSGVIPGAVYTIDRIAGNWVAGARIAAADLSPLAQYVGFAVAADAGALVIGAPRSGSAPPYGNPFEGSAFVVDDQPLFADGFEP